MTDLTFDRKAGMFGQVRRIKGRIGLAGPVFAEAFFDDIKQEYGISFYDADGRETSESTVDASQDCTSAVDAVEALMSLTYRNSLPKPTKVAARYLAKGDRVGSGETVVWSGVGARTPRGKVEVILEKDGKRRSAVWGASTVITVRRAA